MEVTQRHRELLAKIRPRLVPWRKFTVAIDGMDGVGKSTLARFLGWRLGITVVELDVALLADEQGRQYDQALMERLIKSRHRLDRPVIVEGIFVLRALAARGIAPEFVVNVRALGRAGSEAWKKDFQDYAGEYPRGACPDFTFSWNAEAVG